MFGPAGAGFPGLGPFGHALNGQGVGGMDGGMGLMHSQAGNRTVRSSLSLFFSPLSFRKNEPSLFLFLLDKIYMGNLHPETTTEELCNAVRGGMLAQ